MTEVITNDIADNAEPQNKFQIQCHLRIAFGLSQHNNAKSLPFVTRHVMPDIAQMQFCDVMELKLLTHCYVARAKHLFRCPCQNLVWTVCSTMT